MPAMNTQPLSSDQVASFARDGFLHVRSVIAASELASLRAAADALQRRAAEARIEDGDHLYQPDPDDGRPVLFRINAMQVKDPAYLQLWGHPGLLGIAEALHGPDLLPMAMAMVVKTPGFGAAVPWHRDPANCRVRHGINLGIYLDDADAENGMLHVVPGSHRRRTFDLPQALERHGFDLPGSIPVPTRAGDVIVHSENVLHGSREVRSRRVRRVIYFGVRTVEEQLADRGLDLAWIRSTASLMRHAIASRSAASVGRGEAPFDWRPTVTGASVDLPPPADLRIHGHDGPPSRMQQLRFEDEATAAAR
jgi:ectoine hydroxylase-related dioxygenase (phytanoyl-CoA dioxygenase family)